jgi:hypothetical protein
MGFESTCVGFDKSVVGFGSVFACVELVFEGVDSVLVVLINVLQESQAKPLKNV